LRASSRSASASISIEVSIGRLLKELGFAHFSARPRHPKQDKEAIETFKKTFPAKWPRS
jgi:putative transposase